MEIIPITSKGVGLLGDPTPTKGATKGSFLRITIGLHPDTQVPCPEYTDYAGVKKQSLALEDLELEDQREYLSLVVRKGVQDFMSHYFEEVDNDYMASVPITKRSRFTFELTKNGLVHIHGFIRYRPEKQYKINCVRLQTCIWKYIHDHDNNRKPIAIKVLNGFVDENGKGLSKWVEYMEKDQDEIDLKPLILDIRFPKKFDL